MTPNSTSDKVREAAANLHASEDVSLQYLLRRDAGWVRTRAISARIALERVEAGSLDEQQRAECEAALDAIDQILSLSMR